MIVRDDLFAEGQADGDFPVFIEKLDSHGAFGVIQVTVDGVALPPLPYDF